MSEMIKIYQVDAEEAARIALSENNPHQHEFEELIIGTVGRLEHFIDFRSTMLRAPFVTFVTKGKVHRAQPIAENGSCDMWVIRFKSEFIAETAFQLYAMYHEDAGFELKPGGCYNRLPSLCAMMQEELNQVQPDYAILRQLLSSLLTMIEAEKRKLQDELYDKTAAQNDTFRNFLAQLEESFKENHSVEYYAKKLFMSARNLNIICQQVLQQSVFEIIETRKLMEAKNLLSSTNMSISEIGFELGYNETAYFSSVFKKKTGMTPTQFRKQMAELIS